MKVLLTISLCILSHFLFSHDYIKTVEEGKEWYVKVPHGLGTYTEYSYRINCDTTINGKEYKMVRYIPNTNSIFGYVREDTLSQKLYYIEHDSSQEKLIADYSLNQDDSFAWPVGLKSIVDTVFDSTFFGKTRKVIYFNSSVQFFEGIGYSFNGVIGLSFYSYITNVQSTSLTCGSVTSIRNNKNRDIKIVPNIVTDYLYLNDFEALKNRSFKIVNIYGQPVLEGELLKNSIDVSSLHKGNYYLLISSGNNPIPLKFLKL